MDERRKRGRGAWRSRMWTRQAIAGCVLTTTCGEPSPSSENALGVLAARGIDQVAFIRRPKRLEVGDVFQYTSFSVDPRSANIYRIGEISGGAEPEPVTRFGEGDLPAADIMAMDVSFDGQEIAFSARLEGDATYNLYRIKIDGTHPEEPGQEGPMLVHAGPHDAVYPVYLPGDRLFFMTNEAPAGVHQFVDEYERGVTAQAATIDLRGGDLRLGPRNLSHRVFPTLAAFEDNRGQILHTNWDHLGEVNEGNLMVMNPDMTGGAEFFGKEGRGLANSYLRPRQVDETHVLAIATARERTFQAGAIVLIERSTNEADASVESLTPDVPMDRDPSFDRVGRYYDAYPVTNKDGKLTHVLATWANGPVQTDVAGGGELEGQGAGPPDFGIYLFDRATGNQVPLVNDEEMWDVSPLPIGRPRNVPRVPDVTAVDTADETALIGAQDVLESSLPRVRSDEEVYRVRIIEGFSSEEGVPSDFGMSESDGAILVGEAEVKWETDRSFAARVPENRPLHLQLLDGYGMAAVNEDRWFSAAAGEQRLCGGCHETRGQTEAVDPGLFDALGEGPQDFALPYAERRLEDATDTDYTRLAAKVIEPKNPKFASVDRLRGVPWNLAIQPIFDEAGCVHCHDGTLGPANPGVILRDTSGPEPLETRWVFDLRGDPVELEYGEMTGAYSRSHVSLLLLAGLRGQEELEIEPLDPSFPYKSYVVPQSARDSVLLRMVRPERVFPHHEASDLAFATELREDGLPYAASHPNAGTPGFDPAEHRALTRAEKYLLILMADLGGQYYSLENADGYVAPPREEKP